MKPKEKENLGNLCSQRTTLTQQSNMCVSLNKVTAQMFRSCTYILRVRFVNQCSMNVLWTQSTVFHLGFQ